jgi:predicted lipoprotein with Yx(FWY)xxD motif
MPARRLLAAAVACSALAAPAGVMAANRASTPVKTYTHATFGKILLDKGSHAIYWWNREKDRKVHCTGSCATAWPPVLVPKGATFAKHVAGVMGTFGVVMRADGSHQLTFNGRPLYIYQGDAARQVKCNGVDGWFVVRVHG